MRTVALIVAVALVAVVASVNGQRTTDAALNKLAVEFAAAFNAKDAAKVASFYTDDAVLMPPGQPMRTGRRSIEAHYQAQFALGDATLRLTPLESVVAGEIAFEMGTANISLGSLTDDGKYVVIYKRVGTDWKIAYDIFNSDQLTPSNRNLNSVVPVRAPVPSRHTRLARISASGYTVPRQVTPPRMTASNAERQMM